MELVVGALRYALTHGAGLNPSQTTHGHKASAGCSHLSNRRFTLWTKMQKERLQRKRSYLWTQNKSVGCEIALDLMSRRGDITPWIFRHNNLAIQLRCHFFVGF